MKFRLGIRSKLIGIINFILLAAAATIVTFATQLFSKDNTARVQESNLDTARLIGEQVRKDLVGMTEKMRHIGVILMQSLPPAQLEALQKPFFDQEQDLLAQSVVRRSRKNTEESVGKALNENLIKQSDVTAESVLELQKLIPTQRIFSGAETILSGQLKGSIPVITIAIPLMTDDTGAVTHAVIATFKQDRFLKSVSSEGIITSYLVDSEGFVLAHPDQERVLKRANVSNLPIVKQMIEGKTNNGQRRFEEPDTGVPYLGAFRTVGFGGIGVVSQVEEAKALEAAAKVRNTSILITGIVGVFAFLFVFFYSLSLTTPLLRLVDATTEISKGNYDVQLKKPSNDEIGDLTSSFNDMATGLAEREKIKNAFSKFHSKDVADKILSGELKLQGERKRVTIFFSDIRSFTSISEKLEPEQVVELVNSYMTRMVRIIFAHGGVVDKYVGDAIMAVYGTPVSYGDDAVRAVAAAVRMRAEMVRYNDSQAAQGKPVIAIGMGLNTGDVVSGNIGSPERMEYTILGDNVNLTSRMESLTKEYKTDLLISGQTYDEIKDWFECEACGATKVKGKAEDVLVYKVLGFKAGKEYIPPETGTTGETFESTDTASPGALELGGAVSTSETPPPLPEVYATETPVAVIASATPDSPAIASPVDDGFSDDATREFSEISKLIETGASTALPGAEASGFIEIPDELRAPTVVQAPAPTEKTPVAAETILTQVALEEPPVTDGDTSTFEITLEEAPSSDDSQNSQDSQKAA